MRTSPFVFGKTVSAGAFTNREEDLSKLYQNMTTGVNSMLISPRRWGKSSLVERLIKEINEKDKKLKAVTIDLFSVGDEAEFLEILARKTIQASSGKWEEWLKMGKTFLKHLSPQFSFGVDPINDFTISFDWQAVRKHKDEILNLPEEIAKKKKIHFIICLDEFQNLTAFPEYEKLEKAMRAAWQHQKRVTYCLYGSKRHMMTDIFNNPSKPFFRFGELILLQKIKREKWVAFIQQKFKETDKQIKLSLAEKITDLMKNHSWYVQQLSHYTWLKTKKIVNRTNITNALDELISTNIPFYQKETERLSIGQINLLKAIAEEEQRLTAMRVLDKYKLGTSGSVIKNRTTLRNADIIDNLEGRECFLDPAFEMWFKQEYLGIPWSADE